MEGKDRLLGMYVHMHWGYNYPYAARTWRIEDWAAYLDGLQALGYNLVQIWPMIDTMPLPLTESDRAHLQKMARAIDLVHERGMAVYVGASANAMGNARAADYAFEERPYFTAERLVNPGDTAEVGELMRARRAFLEPLAEADGFWIIDSDPGGYAGSSVAEFVRLLGEHRALLDDLRPGIQLFYWMWVGWTGVPDLRANVRERSLQCLRDALRGMAALNPEPWGLLACSPDHLAVVEELGLTSRALYDPYGTIEDEPSFPWTHCDPDRIRRAFERVSRDRYPLGAIGNAQSHCLQLPHIYFFQRFASEGTAAEVDLRGFGEDLLPGYGDVLAGAWEAMGKQDLAAGDGVHRLERAGQANAFAALRQIPAGRELVLGRLAGLYFGQADRLLRDLEAQIAVRIALLKVREQIAVAGRRPAVRAGRGMAQALRNLVPPLQAWAERHGFVDRYVGTFKSLLHPLLREAAGHLARGEQLWRALEDFDAGPPHGAFTRLLRTLKQVVGRE